MLPESITEANDASESILMWPLPGRQCMSRGTQAYFQADGDLMPVRVHRKAFGCDGKLSQEFTVMMQEAGVSLAELLLGLEEERKLIFEERYR